MVVDQESLLNQIKMEIYHVAIKVGKNGWKFGMLHYLKKTYPFHIYHTSFCLS